MEKIAVNGKLELTLPDGFHVMSYDEKSSLELLLSGDYIGFTDPERHIIGTAGCRDLGLASILIGVSDAVKSAQRQISSAMQNYGYGFQGFSERKIAGKKAGGLDYSYNAKDTDMCGQTCTMKDGRYLYYFNVYFRKEMKEDSLRVWNEILDSAVRI